jgi:hypothetical protein
VRLSVQIGAKKSTLTIRSVEGNPRKTDYFIDSQLHFMDDLFAFDYTFMDEHSNPKRHKHEIYTKDRRRKHERYTQCCVFFVPTEDKTIGRKQSVDL